ncbi:MAG: class I SAM-dependent methyltransferase [Actinobacteria bacterium]|nr:class I SAM-dependent methyltransferase [Actinomycetota bacterium]MCL6104796.1 class I SAM-dependent methyltransferase [Actinomycetota bacterium]
MASHFPLDQWTKTASGPITVKTRDPVDGEMVGRWYFDKGGKVMQIDLSDLETMCTIDGHYPDEGGCIPGFVPWPRMTFEINGHKVDVVSGDDKVLKRHYSRKLHQQLSYCRTSNLWQNEFHLARIKQCKRMLSGVTGKVLDVGSGYSMVNMAGPWNFKLILLDRDYEAIRDATGQAGLAKVVGEVAAMPFREGIFDAVYCGEIIEHLVEPDKALLEWNRILQKRGRMALTTPNRRHLMARLTGIETVQNPEHLFEYTYDELLKAVNESGAVVVNIEGLLLPLPWYFPTRGGWRDLAQLLATRMWFPKPALRLLNRLGKFFPRLAMNFGVVAVKI